MCDDDIHQGAPSDPAVSRRTFGLSALAVAGVATGAVAADAVVEKDVDVKTADGVADAALYYPSGRGGWPAVLIWTDIMGLRPAFRDMGRRMAAQGYVVLVPNPFYRVKRSPVVDPNLDFNNPDDRAKILNPANRRGMDATGMERDSVAFLGFLDAQPQTNKKKGAGVQGYCMGGPLTFRTAAAVPGRIRAAGSFHGGTLVSPEPDSPHLLIPRIKAEMICAVAKNDDARTPTDKDRLKEAFAAAKVPAKVEVYAADHGWCVPGGGTYNQAEAERAWAELTALYKRKLV